jgi:hypothetical protein
MRSTLMAMNEMPPDYPPPLRCPDCTGPNQSLVCLGPDEGIGTVPGYMLIPVPARRTWRYRCARCGFEFHWTEPEERA